MFDTALLLFLQVYCDPIHVWQRLIELLLILPRRESELVFRFNTEYRSSGFAIISIAGY